MLENAVVFWNITLRSLVDWYRRFGETCYLHRNDWSVKMIVIYITTRLQCSLIIPLGNLKIEKFRKSEGTIRSKITNRFKLVTCWNCWTIKQNRRQISLGRLRPFKRATEIIWKQKHSAFARRPLWLTFLISARSHLLCSKTSFTLSTWSRV
jgi:hypothetical protein